MKGLIFFLLFRLCTAYFKVPNVYSNVEESFVFKGRTEYLMLNIPVTWDEAMIICDSYNKGSMAVIDTEEIANFTAEALFETNLEMEDLWVGARRYRNSTNFEWVNNRGVFEPKLARFTLPRGRETLTANMSRDCLSFARNDHSKPCFVSLECNLHRPMMCEKPYEKIFNGSMTTSEWIRVEKVKYGIFYDRKTWAESVSECRKKHDAHLASFRTKIEVDLVGRFELIGRPMKWCRFSVTVMSIKGGGTISVPTTIYKTLYICSALGLENAWIGGHYREGRWKFVYNDKTIPTETNLTTKFPPWRGNRNVRRAGCLLLDRHLSDQPVFLEARCERARSYICTKIVDDMPDYQIFLDEEHTAYVLYFIKKTWDDAWETCQELGGPGCHLAKVTKHNIHDMMYMMGENFTVINHVWIGGRLSLEENKFFWVSDSTVIFPNNVNLMRYPPWYDNKYEDTFGCLNLDRENHNRPMFYGTDCDTPQAFICQTKDTERLPEPSTDWLVNLTSSRLTRYGSYYLDDVRYVNDSEIELMFIN